MLFRSAARSGLQALDIGERLCLPCCRTFSLPTPPLRRGITTSAHRTYYFSHSHRTGKGARHADYFWPNSALKELFGAASLRSTVNGFRKQSTIPADTTVASIKDASAAQSPASPPPPQEEEPQLDLKIPPSALTIPLDASNRLTTLSAQLPRNSFRRLFTTYLSLSKPRLTFLIVLTTTAAYSLYPVPALLQSSATAAPTLSTLTLLFLTTGTFLCSASANTLNMLMEPEHDGKMSRTRNRPLVRKLLTSRAALVFATVCGVTGTIALYAGVNPTTAFLGALNIFVYAGMYTPLKRISVMNTWVGAVVGGIPPLMGWTAAAGQCATGAGDWHELLFGEGTAGGWLLAALLFCWQFPHFNALSWGIREEYKNAGYRMMAWTNPARNARVALRYSVLFVPVCLGLVWCGVVDRWFLVPSTAVNGWVIWESYRFWKYEGKKGSARGLFWASVWHLPLVLVFAMVMKKGLWERVWRAAVGAPPMEDDEWEEYEEGELADILAD
ncbi:mitochondria protoheme IX farnesyltransferase [Trichodelitschia bisporula]|uniref:Protoheme IX farnesyltransferase, mitochondrial n=1 Tax=Trichodelitschia bisporula TaxID=703511 RepID=A0A6G1I3G1_9PEZI|nr:mitochondria protoheme IX farnesyltransferase [Trichodelitschia bisporula]